MPGELVLTLSLGAHRDLDRRSSTAGFGDFARGRRQAHPVPGHQDGDRTGARTKRAISIPLLGWVRDHAAWDFLGQLAGKICHIELLLDIAINYKTLF